jgi:hypothetical protein
LSQTVEKSQVPTIETPYRDQDEAAIFAKTSPRTLEKLRVTGGGPSYRKIGRRVIYHISDLTAWIESKKRTSTSDKGSAA